MLHPLVNEVKTIKQNSDYRIADVLFQRGPRWKHSLEKVKNLKKYEGTILQDYLRNNKINQKLDFKLLLNCIENFNDKRELQIKKPSNNEIVLHLRLGDVITLKRFLKKDYVCLIKKIINKNNNINQISIVTCYQYAPFSEDSLYLAPNKKNKWNYTEFKQNQNKQALSNLIKKIEKNCNLKINIFSNINIDKDLYYCVFAKYLITDNGGFDELIGYLNQISRNKNFFWIVKYKYFIDKIIKSIISRVFKIKIVIRSLIN